MTRFYATLMPMIWDRLIHCRLQDCGKVTGKGGHATARALVSAAEGGLFFARRVAPTLSGSLVGPIRLGLITANDLLNHRLVNAVPDVLQPEQATWVFALGDDVVQAAAERRGLRLCRR